ncbi:tetratricopeptide repeat protein [Actibacterium sp. D379-3]
MKRFIFVAILVLGLAACESSEERAQKHYEAAVALLQDGDTARGLVELRNVFKLNGQHREARLLYAQTQFELGNSSEAYGQYLRLVEQYPDDPEGNRALAELALSAGNWEDARRYTDAALALTPEDQTVQAIRIALDFRAAAEAGDTAAQAMLSDQARALLQKDSGLFAARDVVVGALLAEGDWQEALAEIDAGLAIGPGSRGLYGLRLGVLDKLGDTDGITAQLRLMAGLFPQDAEISATLVRWYVSQGQIDEAEAWLRDRIDPAAADPTPRLTLVRFLSELRDAPSARAELVRSLTLDPLPNDVAANLATFRSLHAGFTFEIGDHDRAIAEMEDILQGADPSEEIDRIKVSLAQMYAVGGNQVGARALIEAVLEHDPTQIGALKLKAGWLIDDDRTGDAILTLRTALSVAPRDPDLMTLMARAHEREGNRELMGEMLSLAVDASGRAPVESLRYARFLVADGQYRTAENILIEALRLAPGDVSLLSLLGNAHLGMEDWPRVDQDIARLREIGTGQSIAAANELQAQVFAVQRRTGDLVAFLEEIAGDSEGEAALAAAAAVIRSHILAGQVDAALERSAELLAARPEAAGVRFIRASVLALAGREPEAEAMLQMLVAETPTLEAAWTTLYGILVRRDDLAGAVAVLDAAQAALPDSTNLKWIRAGFLERQGDLEGAIAIYETLYAENSALPVVANNLASLLSTARSDAESLERAYKVARRLRGSDVPPFQDTYGWIVFRRGAPEEALPYLEAAAEKLPGDPGVQYHLGRVYTALGRNTEAQAQFAKAAEVLVLQPHPQLEADIAAALQNLAGAPEDGQGG